MLLNLFLTGAGTLDHELPIRVRMNSPTGRTELWLWLGLFSLLRETFSIQYDGKLTELRKRTD